MLSIYKKNREKELNAALLTYSSKRERKKDRGPIIVRKLDWTMLIESFFSICSYVNPENYCPEYNIETQSLFHYCVKNEKRKKRWKGEL